MHIGLLSLRDASHMPAGTMLAGKHVIACAGDDQAKDSVALQPA